MGRLLNLVDTAAPRQPRRDYSGAKMVDDKVHCMLKGKRIRTRLLGWRPPLRLWRLSLHRGPLGPG